MTPTESDAWRPNIPGWSTDILPFYDRLARELPNGSVFVEVGVAFGRSLAFLASVLCDLEKDAIQLWGVDRWEPGWADGFYSKALDTFASHLNACECERVRLLRLDSRQAWKLFEPFSVDVVFIDAGHTYDEVATDISLWRTRVKKGGIVAGHDYGQDHEGVKKAVDEAYPDGVTVEGTVWWVRK